VVAARRPYGRATTLREVSMTKQELKEQNEALRNLLMEIRDMIDSELEAMDEFDEEEEEEEEDE